MVPFLGYKIRSRKTGLFMGPGVIGRGRWTKVGRTWTSKSALSNSITIWLERLSYSWVKPDKFHKESEDWVIVGVTERGLTETPFVDWVNAKQNGLPPPAPAASVATLTFTPNEIDIAEQALRAILGDADESGALILKVVEAMKHYEVTV